MRFPHDVHPPDDDPPSFSGLPHMPCFSNSETLALRSTDAACRCPDSSASSSAVAEPPRKLLSLAECFKLEPAASKSCKHSVEPFAAAACRGEYPPFISDFAPVTAAPPRIKALHAAPFERCDARCRGVAPSLFRGSLSAPNSRSASRERTSSALAASCSAVSPPSSCKDVSAPPSTSARIASGCPQLAATIKGVWPSESRSSTRAPIRKSARIAGMSPSSAAWCNGVAASCCGPFSQNSSSSRFSAW
mmetsp:Transcript_5712/g.21633  ORF Transcript_5712/g.21633 Transcript_5712/m.21633 type:complete len:248 (+) Transcript_5712:1597-2340(+)